MVTVNQIANDQLPIYGGDMAGTEPLGDENDPGRPPAPEPLETVRRFVNTLEIDEATDELETPERLRVWLDGAGLPGGDAVLTDADVVRARQVREDLRALMLANNGEELDPAAVRRLDEASRAGHLRVRFDDAGGATLYALGEGLDAAFARLFAIVEGAMADGTWRRLKACRNATCEWAFYDRSKNRSSRWCSMSVCGSRMKARAYRSRRRAPADA